MAPPPPAARRHQLAEEATRPGAAVPLLTPGCDGSPTLIADMARRRGITFVCVPVGPDFSARELGVPRAEMRKTARTAKLAGRAGAEPN